MKEVISKIKDIVNGMEYRSKINPEAVTLAKDNGIVILYGQSDDLMELEGAIDDEVYAYDGLNHEDDFDLGNFPEEVYTLMKDHKLELVWCPDEEKSWAFKVSPDSTFERFNIMEDGGVFSEGIILMK